VSVGLGIRILTLAERPDLAAVVAAWQTLAFPDEETAAAALARVSSQVAAVGPEQVFVLLVGKEPAGTASLVHKDLPARPDLTPWLASVYVVPAYRGRGYAASLVAMVEAAARKAEISTIWLFTASEKRLYARLGWIEVGQEADAGKQVTLMRRDLGGPAPARDP
jgi:GNAT superfamily N-acetyltransferase